MPGLVSLPRVPAHWTTELHRPAPPLDPAIRAAGAIGLLAVGLIHILEIQGQLNGAAWLTAGFVLLAASAPVAGLWLLARPSSAAWQLSGLICLSAAGGYILTRSVPVPGDTGDRGNWLGDPLGPTSLFVEGIVIILAVFVVASIRARGTHAETAIPPATVPAPRRQDTAA
jgi:hypothetical protein